jgi:1,4-alpha-glucan branching enzyme
MHRGVQMVVRDLNRLYREQSPLHELDTEPEGFAWIDANSADDSTLSYLRRSRDPHALAVVVCNFTPVVRQDYRIGVPRPGRYVERLNTDALEYGGSGIGNAGEVHADPRPWHGHAHSLCLTLPPLATVIFIHDPGSG